MKTPAAVPEGTANREMCTFLILNISSLQLIPVNIIAYRSQYGSVHPTAIVGPALAATAASTIAAVVFCKVMERMIIQITQPRCRLQRHRSRFRLREYPRYAGHPILP